MLADCSGREIVPRCGVRDSEGACDGMHLVTVLGDWYAVASGIMKIRSPMSPMGLRLCANSLTMELRCGAEEWVVTRCQEAGV